MNSTMFGFFGMALFTDAHAIAELSGNADKATDVPIADKNFLRFIYLLLSSVVPYIALIGRPVRRGFRLVAACRLSPRLAKFWQ